MIFSPAYYLEANRPFFPRQLVPEQALAQIMPIAATLPPVSNIAIECRLPAGATNVDFIPQFVRRGGSGAVLAGHGPDDPVWSQVRRFCAEWVRPASFLQGGIREIWLEFDVAGDTPELPQPSVFIGFDSAAPPAEYQQLSEVTITTLQAELLSASFRRNLATCFAALPAAARLFSLGVMLARRYDRARVCVGNVPKDQALAYLQQIGWPGPLDRVQELIGDLSPLVDEYGLALDVGDNISPKLGLECYLLEPSPAKESRWSQLLDYLAATGQCAPEKKEGLLRWPGRQFHGLSPDEAAQLRATAHSGFPRLHNIFTRKISHLKVVLEPGKPQETKAYLELNNTWLPLGPPE
ncbi:MAG: hypothetical protein L0332_02730 [Chloroflexi bacterium]|nr:hypothetical protein [Chloroflexota bacterium]MCI0576025.1 hypothetical protein [Chloroflexota bacterium]MCI0645149.1 hypothetical protein [Chloroflexota bacterium]MCI0725629.1 hypothetical protein [Chloroflexota bacterium]